MNEDEKDPYPDMPPSPGLVDSASSMLGNGWGCMAAMLIVLVILMVLHRFFG